MIMAALALGSCLLSASVAAPLPRPKFNATTIAAPAKCACKADATAAQIAGAMDWVCGAGGVDCSSIGGAHPTPTIAHASFAFDAYYQKHKADGRPSLTCGT